MREINTQNIKRHGGHIRLGGGITAKEGKEGGLKTLIIREKGKIIARYRGNSLYFLSNQDLTEEDKDYLKALAE